MSGADYERALVELLFVLPGGLVTYEGVFLLTQGAKRRMLDKNSHIDSGGKKGKCDKVTEDGEDPQALVNQTLMLFEWDDKALKEGDDCLAAQMNLYADYPKCKHMASTKMTSCGLDELYMKEWAHLYSVLQTGPETTSPPAELVLPTTMTNMARQLIAELLLLDEGYGYESELLFAKPLELDDDAEARELQHIAWDHDEPLWRTVNPDDPNVGRFERLFCTGEFCTWRQDAKWQRIAPFLLFYFRYEPFLALVREEGRQFLQHANATIQDKIAERRVQYDAGYWDRHEKRWGFYGKQWAPKVPDLLYMLAKRNPERITTKPTPAEELDWTEDWLTRRSRAVDAWLPTVQPGDLHYVDIDMIADAMSMPAMAAGIVAGSLTGIGIFALTGIGIYRLAFGWPIERPKGLEKL